MMFPFQVTHTRAFTFHEIHLWAECNQPTQIEMTDRQYAYYLNLCASNRKHFENIPIVFAEGPMSAV